MTKIQTKTRRSAPKPDTQLKGLPLYNPVAIELRYSRELRALTRVMTKETDAAVRALFKSPDAKEFFAMDASIAIQAREMMNLLTIRFQSLFSSHAERMARRMVGAVDEQSRVSLDRSFKKLTNELTIKTSEIPPALKTIYEASISENVDLIKSIPEQYLNRIKGAVNRSITGSGGLGPLVGEIKKYGGMTDRRAKLISMDQVRKAYQSANVERAKAAGVKKGIWVHTGGTKEPRHKHKEFNGKEFILADGAPVGDKGQMVQPGEEVNCFPGHTLLKDCKGLKKLFRRFYSGKLARIVTNDNEVLEVTPNHPLLTNRGWIAAGEIKAGDYVVKTLKHGALGINADIDNGVSSIQEVFELFASVFGVDPISVKGSSFNFHGDHSNGDIDIVFIDRLLGDGIEAKAAKMVTESILADANITWAELPGNGTSYELVMRAFDAPDRIVRGLSPILAKLSSLASSADDVGLRLIAQLNACFEKAGSDSMASDIESLGELENADTRVVELANFFIRKILALTSTCVSWDLESSSTDLDREIIRVAADELGSLAQGGTLLEHFDCVEHHDMIDYAGHVFNLENDVNWYTANNTTVHNCRCTFTPVVDFEDL